ncbi:MULTISPECIES: RecB family exonuclease [Streptomyces]|uniref:RecB family exonuclease n=1 Tax=Streptomyces sp. endophyte_N2 TaxID=2153485 RepID=UPI001F4FCD31|nr:MULTISPECIES: RecB family exonuclease [Streptomyces]
MDTSFEEAGAAASGPEPTDPPAADATTGAVATDTVAADAIAASAAPTEAPAPAAVPNPSTAPDAVTATSPSVTEAATAATSTGEAAEATENSETAGSAAAAAAGAPTDAAAAPPVPRPAAAPTSLSPSRAGDFMQCPLLYRFRVIDRLPEKPSEAATRGTLVHAVLERLFDAPAGERTAPRARALVPGQWDRLRESRPELAELFADDPDGQRLARWLGEAERLVERWFTLEDPTRLEPAERELFVEAELESGPRLRGIIDRVDVAPTGEVRIVDYKTGKAPRPEYAEGALFQMKFYALVVWRLKGVVPRRLQLVYLGSGEVRTYDPVLADLERVERRLRALWDAICEATESGEWRPRPTKLCGWCDHQAHCPEFGGTPPPYPLPVRARESGGVPQGRMGAD